MQVTHPIFVINTGVELLEGLRVNQHLAYIGNQLSSRGGVLQQGIVVGDDKPAIKKAFLECWEKASVLILTGGLGPTQDDNTKEAVAEALGLKLEHDHAIEKALEERLAQTGRQLSQLGKKQCYRPEGFVTLPNAFGMAPGLYYHEKNKHLFLLPGPKQELKPMFEKEVVPRLKKARVIDDRPAFLQFRAAGIPEVELAGLLDPILSKHSGLGIAYCAHADIVDVRLSPGVSNVSWQVIEHLLADCQRALGEDFLGLNAVTLPEVLVAALRQRNLTISTAESCTGGLLASALTDVPGASKVFAGGLVCYSDDMKIELLNVPEALLLQHGAVSAEVAVAMAVGAMEVFSTDYAISTTGFAGPEGGTDDLPIGTIFLGFASPEGIWSRRLYFPQGRRIVKERTVNAALDWVRRELLELVIVR